MSAQRRHVLIVNPSSGGGRGRALLPQAESAMNRHGLVHRTVFTRSLEHGVEEARAAAAAGEVPVVMSGDGLIGGGRRRAGGHRGGDGHPARRARQRLRPRARDSERRRGGGGDTRRGRGARGGRRRGQRQALPLHRLGAASTPTPTGSRTRRSGSGATSSTRTRRCALSPPGGRRRSRCPWTASRARSADTRLRSPTARHTAGGCSSPRTPSSTTGSSTSSARRREASSAS